MRGARAGGGAHARGARAGGGVGSALPDHGPVDDVPDAGLVDRGLDRDGFIRREGALSRVASEFAAPVGVLRERCAAAYPRQSLYLYGSVPRGTAVPGLSDLDALVVMDRRPTEADHAAADAIEHALDAAHPHVSGVGILLESRDRILSEAERYDLGFFVACLCTPVTGEDLAAHLPRYRPTVRLARDTNGEIADALARARARLDAQPDQTRTLCRGMARKIVRTGFTLVMPRWGGWTSDMELTHRVVTDYYPQWREPLREAITLARRPRGERAVVERLLDFGDQIAEEYATTIGVKSTR